MATQNMVERTIGRKAGFHHEESLLTGVTSNPIIIPPLNGQPVTCTIIAGGNTGKMQFTTSSDTKVAAGTAVWSDWDRGVVTGTVTDFILSAVTAVRGVSSAGAIDFELVL